MYAVKHRIHVFVFPQFVCLSPVFHYSSQPSVLVRLRFRRLPRQPAACFFCCGASSLFGGATAFVSPSCFTFWVCQLHCYTNHNPQTACSGFWGPGGCARPGGRLVTRFSRGAPPDAPSSAASTAVKGQVVFVHPVCFNERICSLSMQSATTHIFMLNAAEQNACALTTAPVLICRALCAQESESLFFFLNPDDRWLETGRIMAAVSHPVFATTVFFAARLECGCEAFFARCNPRR